MTDRELLELAAKAAGIEYLSIPEPPEKSNRNFFGLWIEGTSEWNQGRHWNPLRDSGDALRLAVKLEMCIGPNFDNDRVAVVAGEFSSIHVVEMFVGDRGEATRRAIVRTAAEIGRAEKGGE